LSLWAQAAYEVHHAAHAGKGRKRTVPPVQVSLRMVGAAESRKLNRQWRDEDHATNVLSFPAGEMPDIAGEAPSLGDLAVCVPIVKREAREQGITLDAHWAHMMIHGVLHLLGYDHEDDRDAQVMEACEVAILERFGFASPYAA
jgi:probable rRNA maturation factor